MTLLGSLKILLVTYFDIWAINVTHSDGYGLLINTC